VRRIELPLRDLATLTVGQRVVVLGCPGSGKSVLADALAERTGLPVVRMDDLYWQPGWTRPEPARFAEVLREAVARPQWIIEGNYASSLPIRLERADTAIFVDTPTTTCLWRVLRRGLARARGETESLPQHVRAAPRASSALSIDPAFVAKILTFHRKLRPGLLEQLERFATQGTVHLMRVTS
jgi:hypothetical protein